MTHFFLTFLLTLVLMLPLRLIAQESKTIGSYNSVYVEVPISNKWNWFNENEIRSVRVLNKFYYYEIKSGFNYKHSKKLTLTIALGVYNTFNEGAEYDNMSKKTDYRFWQQLNYKQKFFKGVIEHRVRVEEIINQNFKPAFRYRMQPKWPLSRQGMNKGGLFATAFDELFLQIQTPVVRRNRIFGGFGYFVTNNISIQSGLLRQTDYKPGTENFTKNFFYISGSFKL